MTSITNILNSKTRDIIKWCTPSLDFKSDKVKNPYKSDVSISYESLGFPNIPSGVFKEAYVKAAKVYGTDNTLFSVNGSTGSNFIVFKALSKQIPNLRILAQRNVHKSVVYACEDYGINLMFLPTNIEPKLQIFLPNSIKEILVMIKKTKPQVVLITNPTYEGMVLDLKKMINQVRIHYPNLIIYVEEAWGSHLHFSKKLPISAMEAGADICIQSTHKQGGSLQQSGMIHWKNGRINRDILIDSYHSLSTSSPSFTLLASLDAAREMMEKSGEKKIDYILKISEELAKRINNLKGYGVIRITDLQKRNDTIHSGDESKILVDVSETGLTGYQVAKFLEDEFKIIVEKYNVNTIMFLIPFRAVTKDIDKTIRALEKIAKRYNNGKKLKQISLRIPRIIPKILEVGDVIKLLHEQIEKVPLEKAEGRISAENITPYPPGIPTTIKGEEFTREMIEYYFKLKKYPNSHIIAFDQTLNTVRVVK